MTFRRPSNAFAPGFANVSFFLLSAVSSLVSKSTWATVPMLFLTVAVGPWLLERHLGQTNAELRTALENEYRAAAARGEVAEPATAPTAVQAFARCGNGVPCFLRVRMPSGEASLYIKDKTTGFKQLTSRASPM